MLRQSLTFEISFSFLQNLTKHGLSSQVCVLFDMILSQKQSGEWEHRGYNLHMAQVIEVLFVLLFVL